ncbi:MAG: response regulator [Elusimicrobia bacterium]|nr:response regulator [Elusimicrobiota bacterium]
MSHPAQKRILVIDDSALSRSVLQEALEKKGFRVTLAENGEKGVTLVLQDAPDLILMDVVMPELNGWETCLRIRKAALSKAIPIVIMTSKDTPQDMLQSFEVGADEFISKPVALDELFNTINQLLSSEKFSNKS